MRHRAVNFVVLLAFTGVLVASCGGRQQVAFEDIKTYDRPGVWPGNNCGESLTPLLPEDTFDVTPVSYPTVAGGAVEPGITDVPLPPGVDLIESFVSQRAVWGGNKGAVQVYVTELGARAMFEWFNETLGEAGWELSGSTSGPAGVQCSYVPNLWSLGTGLAPKHWIIVTTEFIPPPGFEQEGDLPPGFRGKSVPFAPRVPGRTIFSVITPR